MNGYPKRPNSLAYPRPVRAWEYTGNRVSLCRVQAIGHKGLYSAFNLTFRLIPVNAGVPLGEFLSCFTASATVYMPADIERVAILDGQWQDASGVVCQLIANTHRISLTPIGGRVVDLR